MDTYELMEEIIDLIKEDDLYQKYKESCLRLEKEENKALLLKHKELQETYLSYRNHLSESQKEVYRKQLNEINEKIRQNEEIMAYYTYYQKLNDELDELKNQLFKGIIG